MHLLVACHQDHSYLNITQFSHYSILYIYTYRMGKNRFTVASTQNSLFLDYCSLIIVLFFIRIYRQRHRSPLLVSNMFILTYFFCLQTSSLLSLDYECLFLPPSICIMKSSLPALPLKAHSMWKPPIKTRYFFFVNFNCNLCLLYSLSAP